MTYTFFRQFILGGLALLAWFGILTACVSGSPRPVVTASPRPSQTISPIPTTTLPSAAITPSLTLSPSPEPSQILTPTFTPFPSQTFEPTGIFPEGDQIGQNPYSAVVSYPGVLDERITETVHFLLYLPASYGKDPATRWPLLIYLHGSGSRGNDLSLVRINDLPKSLDNQPDFPFIVLSPQCPANYDAWSGQIDTLNSLLDLVLARYTVDPRRIYLTGYSMGGFGTWEFALRYPQRFAAIAPVAGGYIYQSTALPPNLCDLKNLPVWVFHGAKDTTVAPEQDISLVNALKACHGNVRLTLYPDADHSTTVTRAYSTVELFQWLSDWPKVISQNGPYN